MAGKVESVLVVAMACALMGCAMRSRSTAPSVPLDFDYPAPMKSIEYDEPVAAGALTGIVRDASGAPRERILVERVAEPKGARLDARFTDRRGRFSFDKIADGLYRLKFSFPGFDTVYIAVRVQKKMGRKIEVELPLSQ